MDFVAIDFETANQEPSSACSVGIVTVRGGNIADRWYRLIRPRPFDFDPFNVSIHGITDDMVANEPEFGELWPEMQARLQGETVFAHYAAFDMRVLRAALDAFGTPYPALTFGCSRNAAKVAHPDLLSFSLPVVAEHLGITFEHHNALADAEACARVVLDAALQVGATTVDGLFESPMLFLGALFPGGYTPTRYRSPRAAHKRPSPEPTVDVSQMDHEHPFFGAQVVFTGALESMTRAQAQQLVVNVGGNCADSVTKKTNFLVSGMQDFKMLNGQTKSSKLRKAETLKQAGQDIELISEMDFLQAVGGPPTPGQHNPVIERFRPSRGKAPTEQSPKHAPVVRFENDRMVVTEDDSGGSLVITFRIKPTE
jgi:DNA polymerase-3 subunit epsilon